MFLHALYRRFSRRALDLRNIPLLDVRTVTMIGLGFFNSGTALIKRAGAATSLVVLPNQDGSTLENESSGTENIVHVFSAGFAIRWKVKTLDCVF